VCDERVNYGEQMCAEPAISIVIPVLDESQLINDLLAHIHSLDGSKRAEVIVVDGDGSRSTLQAIADVNTIKIVASPGRAVQMNAGAKASRGRILLFLHADTNLPACALNRIEEAMESGAYVAGAFDLGIHAGGFPFRIIERVASMRSRITRIPFGDQAIFIRKDYFESIGGYEEIPLMEDVEIMRRIRKRGDSIMFVNEKVDTSPRRWEREGVVLCTLRNWFLQILYLSGVSPDKLGKFYTRQ